MGTEEAIKSLEKQISFKDFKLHSLLEITKAINTNEPVDRLVDIFEYILREQLGFRKFILFNHQDQWNCLLKVGFKGKVKDINVDEDLKNFKDITLIESSYKQALNGFDVVVPVFHKQQPLAYLLIGDLDKEHYKLNSTINNMTFIRTLANIIVMAIENKRLANESLKQERVKKELEVASTMQRFLFPQTLPSDKKVDISAKYFSRHEIGGDYYDYFQLNDDEFVICMADVSGKGIAAAMLMANFQATVRTLFEYNRFPLKLLIHELNRKVMKNANGEKFITFFVAEYSASKRQLRYINAGHNYPILTDGKNAQYLDKGCVGLGMFDEIPTMEVQETIIRPNTTLCLYTDGVVELENSKGEQFETENLIKIIHSFYPLQMEDLNEIIFSKLDTWRNQEEFVDDTAILSCRIF